MLSFSPTIIWRHRRENLKKCSLRGLENRPDFRFFTYPQDPLPALEGYLLLSIEGEPLSSQDASSGLFLIDGTWDYAKTMEKQVPPVKKRSLPAFFTTAYPRKQTGCLDPVRGLASVEALFIAYHLLGRPTEGLLDSFYWKARFLELNQDRFDFLTASSLE